MASVNARSVRFSTPLEILEQVANQNDWAFERSGEDELTLAVAGSWTDYQLSLHWREDLETVHIACAFDFKVPDSRLTQVYRLVAQINEQLWLGHFDIWASDGLILYRHGLMLNNAIASKEQCEALLEAALDACERYYQAFQFVVWAGKAPREALAGTCSTPRAAPKAIGPTARRHQPTLMHRHASSATPTSHSAPLRLKLWSLDGRVPSASRRGKAREMFCGICDVGWLRKKWVARFWPAGCATAWHRQA